MRIVDPDLATRVDEQLSMAAAKYHRTNPNGGRAWGAGAKYLLTGLLKCGLCGAGLEVRTRSHGSRRVPFYECSAFRRKGKSVCRNNLAIRAGKIEAEILREVEACVLDVGVIEEMIRRAVARIALPRNDEGIDEELNQVEREMARLLAAITATDSPTLYQEFVKKEAERNRLRRCCRRCGRPWIRVR